MSPPLKPSRSPMGRRGGYTPSHRRTAPRRTATTRVAAPRHTATNRVVTPVHVPVNAKTVAAPTPAVVGAGPSMMGMMGSSIAGSMAGSVVGHGISNMMFGDNGQVTVAPPPAGGAPVVTAPPLDGSEHVDPCQSLLFAFQDCVKASDDSMSVCQFDLTKLRECRMSHNEESEW